MDNCIGCGKIGNKVMYLPNVKGQDKASGKAQASDFNKAPKNNFYALRSRGEQETSPDVVTGMLKVLSIDAFALNYLSATLSFVTPKIAKKFDILPDILHDPFIVSTLVGESVVAKRCIEICPIMLPNRVYYVY